MTFRKDNPICTFWIVGAVCFASFTFSLGCSQQKPQDTIAAEQGGAASEVTDSVKDAAVAEAPKEHTTFRKAGEGTPEPVQRTDADSSPEASVASQRPQLDEPDDRQNGSNTSDSQTQQSGQATPHDNASQQEQQPPRSSEGSSESNADRDVTIREVKANLQAAENALEGYIVQQKKRDYQQAAKEKLQGLDKEIATLGDELNDLRQRESVKEDRLAHIEKKREAFLSELDSLDPTSADDWSDKRRRIDDAWRALQEAHQDGASAERASVPGNQDDAADSGTKRSK